MRVDETQEVPALIPIPTYGPETPEVRDFYDRLRIGLLLTIDGEVAKRQRHLEEADALQSGVDAARAELEAAFGSAQLSRTRLAALQAGPRPWTGLRALQAQAYASDEVVAEASLALRGAEDRRGRSLREAELRVGATRPRVTLQHGGRSVGPAPYGVYAFYDYDGHALYVGKTTEGLSVRVGRHLRNQRTDAVAMSVLDPLEIVEVEVWPIWPGDDIAVAKTFIHGLEFAVEQVCTATGPALFNEKRIAAVENPPALPASVRFDLLGPDLRARLGHPDLRIARRLATSARLAGRIAERSLKSIGLRRSLQRHLARLSQLAEARFLELGGEAAVPIDQGDDDLDSD